MRRLRAVRRKLRAAAALALVALLALGAAPTPFGRAAAVPAAQPVGSLFSAAEADHGLAVQITRISPEVLTDQDAVTVSGTLRNTGSVAVESPEVRLYVQSATSPSLPHLEQYLRGQGARGPLVARGGLDGRLAPGGSRSFSLRVPKGDLPLYSAFQWGPRGITVQAEARGASGSDHSILLWDSGYEVQPTELGVLVPIGASTANPRAMSADSQLLAAQLVGRAGVTLAVDPSTLLDQTSASASPSASPESGSQSGGSPTAQSGQSGAQPSASPSASSGAEGQQDALSTAGRRLGAYSSTQMRLYLFARAKELVVLPQGDADLGLLAASGDQRLLGLARQSIHALDAARGQDDARLLTDVAWPSARTFGLQTLRAFPSATVIAPDSKLRPTEQLTYTPDARIQVRSSTGRSSTSTRATTRVLASSDAIAQLVAHVPTSAADELDTDQLLRAVSVIVTRERPNQSRSLLVALPRGVDSQGLAHRTQALLDNRWVRPRSFSQLASAAPSTDARAHVSRARASAAATEQVAALSEAVRQGDLLAGATNDPQSLTNPLRADALAAVPASAEARAKDLAGGVADLAARVRDLLGKVRAGPSATINLINKSANFPVRVTNQLDRDVTVVVSLVPSDPRLRASSARTVTIRAGREQTVEIPVNAIGSGDITVGVSLRTASGLLLDGSHSVTVRMRAGWEDTGAAVVGALVVAGFVAGMVRTIRRGTRTQMRTRRRASEAGKA